MLDELGLRSFAVLAKDAQAIGKTAGRCSAREIRSAFPHEFADNLN
jgi:hypothetical protein